VLSWSLLATSLFVAVEVTAGLRSHSLALLSDAGHNATDALALLLAWVGVWFQDRPADHVKTFGYQRAGVLVAFVNALTLLGLSGWIFVEAYQRMRNPEAVQPAVMIGVAILGLLLNGGIMMGLNQARHNDLNIRSAFIHMLGDLLGSAAIVVGGAVMYFTGLLQIDTVLSAVIAALIVYTAWDVTKESLNILLEGLPRGMSLAHVEEALGKLELVRYRFKDVVEYRRASRYSLLPDAKVALVVGGEAVGCLDLRKIRPQDVVFEGDTIVRVFLPAPELCSFQVNHDQSRVFSTENGFFEDANLVDEGYKYAEKQVRNAALQAGILAETQRNAEQILLPLLRTFTRRRVVLGQQLTMPKAGPKQ